MSIGEQEEPLWRRCEEAWGRWLESEGHTVTFLTRADGNTRDSEAPLLRSGGRSYRAPDLQSEKGPVKQYWEVKYRSRPHRDPATGIAEHRIDAQAFRDYADLDRLPTGSRVSIVVYEEASPTKPARWLTISVKDARRTGRAARLPGKDGEQTDYWLWSVDSMKEVKAPQIDSRSAEQPLLSDDEPVPTRRAAEFETLERNLRAARARSEPMPRSVVQATLGEGDRFAEGVAHDPAALLATLCASLGIPARPNYSVTLIGGHGVDLCEALGLLHYGIRLFLITENRVDTEKELGADATAFKDARLLELGEAPAVAGRCHWIADGVMPTGTPDWVHEAMEAADREGGLNVSQYRIVHAPAESDVLVSAGAGTGKTETMSERLMFLMCTDGSADFGEVHDPSRQQHRQLQLRNFALITFTREAAREMRNRFAKTMLLRRRLCPGCIHPIGSWLMQLGSVQSSTIHAFAKSLLQRHGHSIGLSPAFRVSKQTLQVRSLLTEELSRQLEADSRTHEANAGVPPFHAWLSHVEAVWGTLENHGVRIGAEGDPLDWGDSGDWRVGIVTQVLQNCAKGVRDLALTEQAIRTGQLVPEARLALQRSDAPMEFRHVFVDEFQDTDASQLNLILDVRQKLGARLFVVGDAKQGVYRFRGAKGNALDSIEEEAKSRGLKPFARFGLTRNFRSGERLLESLHPVFKRWGEKNLLPYGTGDRLLPSRGREDRSGPFSMQPVKLPDYAQSAAEVVKRWLGELSAGAKSGELTPAKATIAVLCRRNRHAVEVQSALRALGISCALEVGGRFFRSAAVREARALLEAIAAPKDLSAALELCETAWGGGFLGGTKAPSGAAECSSWGIPIALPMPWADRLAAYADEGSFPRGDAEALLARVDSISQMVRRMPVPALIAECSRTMTPEAFAGGSINDRNHYRRCLDQLICMIDDAFGTGPGTVHSVLEWLRLQIATNRNEDEPAPPEDCAVRAITVHKAKGREFDFVLMPHTWSEFGPPKGTATNASVLEHNSRKRLVWKWNPKRGCEATNTGNRTLWESDLRETEREEARLLYVAMTRAKHRLLVFHPYSSRPNTWSGLLNERGADS